MTEKKLKGLFGGGEAEEAAPQADRDADREARRAARREARGGKRRELTPEDAEKAQDFVQRYTTGSPTEGFSSEEAVGYLQQLRGEVPPEVLQRAAVATVQNLPDDQRKAFAEMLQRRQQGSGMVTIERTGEARTAQGRGGAQAGGDAGMDDMLGGLFGSLLGGGMAQPAPQPQGRQAPGDSGMDDMLGGLLGSLLGGGAAQAPQGGTAAGDPFGDILGSLLGGDAALPHEEPTSRQRQQPQAQAQGGGIGDILGSPLGKAVLGGIAAYAMKEMMGGNRRG